MASHKDGVIVIAGAGGFIGGHLAASEVARGAHRVRCVDIKPLSEWYQVTPEAENLVLDLSVRDHSFDVCSNATDVYNLAADMGGMGFIEANKGLCMLSVLINTHMLLAARDRGADRFFFSSSACVYNAQLQASAQVKPLREEDAYPALPEDGYGWEKLFSERMCRHFSEDFGLQTRVARFHNVYGPFGTWCGGREKAPAAICRKVIEAKYSGSGEIEIWGTGRQTRSFMYIDDCIEGIDRIMRHEVPEPVNLGSEELVTIDQLVDVVEEISGLELKRRYQLDAPLGVQGRNSDNTRLRQYVGWEPTTSLRDGIRRTYAWIHDEFLKHNDRLRECAS
jgi:nucleoside-diphosphate-sugar epimerase